MGKPTEDRQQQRHPADPESGTCFGCCGGGVRGIARAFTFRCVVVLVLSAFLFLSALFWLPPFSAIRSGRGHMEKVEAPIRASFILHKPVSFLSTQTERLKYDIFEEIGVPNTKVSVVSMRPLTPSNSTYVIFGVLPDSKYATNTINPVILSVLRSSLIELVLQQSNLSLTTSIFGKPSDFEILNFPGGITVIPVQSAPIWQITQNLFNFTLNYSIIQIQKNLDELKGQLKFGLNLRSDENVYVQMTNLNGSTIAPPVIVEASVLSDVGSRNLLPPRLKQLAQTITGSPTKNLGLNHTVFGKVKEVVLSSYLNHSIVLLGSPSPSPSPAYELPNSAPPTSVNLAPSPSYAPPPSNDRYSIPPCFHCDIFPPSGGPSSHAPPPDGWLQAPATQPPSSPAPLASPVARSPRHIPCFTPRQPPEASPSGASQAPVSSDSSLAPAPSPHKHLGPTSQAAKGLSPAAAYHPRHHQNNRGSESSISPLSAAAPISPSPSSNFSSCPCIERRPFLLLWILLFLVL